MTFGEEGLVLRKDIKNSIIFVNLSFSREFFDEYSISENEVKVWVDLFELSKVLWFGKDGDSVSFKQIDSDKIVIQIVNHYGNINCSFEMRILKQKSEDVKPPNFNFPVNAKFPSEKFSSLINSMTVISEMMQIDIKTNQMDLYVKNVDIEGLVSFKAKE